MKIVWSKSILSNTHFAHPKFKVTKESYVDEKKGVWNRVQARISEHRNRIHRKQRDRASSTTGGLNPAFDHPIQVGSFLSFSET
jgi:hypothetical protein